MARRARILTQLAVERAQPKAGGRYDMPDGPGGVGGLALRVGESGIKTWTFRYRFGGEQRRAKLGRHPTMTLVQAREAARKIIDQAEAGVDPAATKEAKRDPERDTVRAVAAEYAERHLRRNTRRAHDAEQMLERDVLPKLGDRLIRSITRRDVLDVVDAVTDRGSPVAANRVLSLVKMLLGWALQRGIVESNVGAGIKPPHREKPRERTLNETEIRLLWQAWEDLGHPFGTIARLLLLTAQRRGEVASMKWEDVDLQEGVLHLAGAATKNEIEHVLPLSPAAVEILRGIPRIADSPLVFPSTRIGSIRPVSGFSKARRKADETALRLLRKQAEERGEDPGKVKLVPSTWHDLRRTAASCMAKRGVAPHVIERILNHTTRSTLGTIASVYNVHTYQGEMRAALELWAAEVERILHGAAVVPFRSRA